MERFTYKEVLDSFDSKDGQDGFLGWAIMTMLAMKPLSPKESGVFEVELKIDGVEHSLRKLLKELFSQWDRQVKDHAIDLLRHKAANVEELLDDVRKKFEKLIKNEEE